LVSEISFEVPNWRTIYWMLLRQSRKIFESGFRPDVLVGVCRGGWFPARVLSDLLENPRLATVSAESYVGIEQDRGQPLLTQTVSADVNGKRVLVVDEIADSGKSLDLVISHIIGGGACEVRSAVLYFKPSSIIKPDYFEKETCCWVVFPWDAKETVRQLFELHQGSPEVFGKEIVKLVDAGLPKWLITRFLNEFAMEDAC
jgi:hypoxanthine phosphoribosyltransferase